MNVVQVLRNVCPAVLAALLLAAAPGCKTTRQAAAAPATPLAPGEEDVRSRERLVFVDACGQMVLDNVQGAIDGFREVLEINPRSHAAMYNLATLYAGQRAFGEALQYATAARDLSPTNPWYFACLRNIHQQKGDLAASIKVQQDILVRFPPKPAEYLLLAELFLENGQEPQAAATLQQAEMRNQGNEDLLLRKVSLYRKLNDPAALVRCADDLLFFAPDNPDYYKLRYEACVAADQPAEARKTLEQMLAAFPNSGYARLCLADELDAAGDTPADSLLAHVFSSHDVGEAEKVAIVRKAIARAHQGTASMERAYRLLGMYRAAYPVSARHNLLVAEIMSMNGQQDSAVFYYRRAAVEDGHDEAVWAAILAHDLAREDYAALVEDGEEAVSFFPNNAVFLHAFGIGSKAEGDEEEAIYALEKVKKLPQVPKPLQCSAAVALGELYCVRKRVQLSEENFAFALGLEPDNAEALAAFAYTLALRNERLPEARQMAMRARALTPDAPLAAHALAEVLLRTDRPAEALPHIELAVQRAPTALRLERYGDILARLGRKNDARAQWEKALQLGATFDLQAKMNS